MNGDRDDWLARRIVRGGSVTYALARTGWLICGTLGAGLMLVLAVLLAQSDPTTSTVESFLGWFAVLVPLGATVGVSGGLLAQSAARGRLHPPAVRIPAHGLHPHGRWARFYEPCARSVASYHEIVETVPEGAGRDWLAGIGEALDGELAEALRLARLGESLEPKDGVTPPGETAYRTLQRLRAAKKSFAETTERAAAIALELHEESDFGRVRAQLDMLAEQAPRLRTKGG
jgi:hypothetical protein